MNQHVAKLTPVQLGLLLTALISGPGCTRVQTHPDRDPASTLSLAATRTLLKDAAKTHKTHCGDDQSSPEKFKADINGKLVFQHLYIGMGLSVIIHTPQGKTLLFDGGTPGSGEDMIIPALRDCYGVKRIDTIVLSHSHDDHYGGLTKLIAWWDAQAATDKEYSIGQIFYPGLAVDGGENHFTEFLTEAGSRAVIPSFGKNTIQLDPGIVVDVVAYDGMVGGSTVHETGTAEVATGDSKHHIDDANANSIALTISYKNFNYFIEGDLTAGAGSDSDPAVEQPLAEYLKKIGAGKVDVMVSPHHGSDTTNSDQMLSVLEPSQEIVSVGNCDPKNCAGHGFKNSVYHLPDQPAIDRMLCIPMNPDLEVRVGTLDKSKKQNSNSLVLPTSSELVRPGCQAVEHVFMTSRGMGKNGMGATQVPFFPTETAPYNGTRADHVPIVQAADKGIELDNAKPGSGFTGGDITVITDGASYTIEGEHVLPVRNHPARGGK